MALYRIQVVLPMVSGVSKDAAQNVWHFSAETEGDLDNVVNALDSFYLTIDQHLSNLVDPAKCRMKVYDLADPEPRAPVRDLAITSLTLGGNPAPTEVAICVSFQGPRVSGASQARRRGRIYLGPLAASQVHTDGRPLGGTITSIVNAADTLVTASKAAAGWSWVVYSRTDGQPVAVNDGWVDNEFDTQRRRGREATTRTTFS